MKLLFGADGETRTPTVARWNLNPVRLPISPRPQTSWGERWDLNPRQPESQSGALPTELRPPQTLIWHARQDSNLLPSA